MKQPIAGVAPRELGEATIMIVYPSIAATGLGQALGRLYRIRAGVGNILTLGNLFALLTIPIALVLYFFTKLCPGVCRRYRLTNRRVVVERGLSSVAERWVSLDRFDTVDVVVRPGQAWYPAGDLVFRKGAVETFRLPGVMHPESFRQTVMKARDSYAGVQKALGQPAVPV